MSKRQKHFRSGITLTLGLSLTPSPNSLTWTKRGPCHQGPVTPNSKPDMGSNGPHIMEGPVSSGSGVIGVRCHRGRGSELSNYVWRAVKDALNITFRPVCQYIWVLVGSGRLIDRGWGTFFGRCSKGFLRLALENVCCDRALLVTRRNLPPGT